MKVGTEKKKTNPVKLLDKINELDKDGIRVESSHFGKKEETRHSINNLASVIVTFLENCVQRYGEWPAHFVTIIDSVRHVSWKLPPSLQPDVFWILTTT
jgi:hypothetical protein